MTGDPQIIVELKPMGSIVRVSAVCTKTGTEVTIQGPASAGRHVLEQNAIKKLKYILSKKAP